VSTVQRIRVGFEEHRISSWNDATGWLDTHQEVLLMVDEDTWLQVAQTELGL